MWLSIGNGEATIFHLHNDAELLKASVNYKAAETNFPEGLVEKDYFCPVLPEYFSTIPKLVFKGEHVLQKSVRISMD